MTQRQPGGGGPRERPWPKLLTRPTVPMPRWPTPPNRWWR